MLEVWQEKAMAKLTAVILIVRSLVRMTISEVSLVRMNLQYVTVMRSVRLAEKTT